MILMNHQLTVAFMNCLALVITLISSVKALATPEVAHPVLVAAQSEYLIQPGRVGNISRNTSRQDLAQLLDPRHLKDFVDSGPDGEGQFPATSVMPQGKRSLEIIWTNNQQKQIRSIRIYDPRWRTAEGIGVQTPVSQLQQLFGPFKFYGFAWDSSGYLIAGNSNLDQYRKRLKLDFHIGLPSYPCQGTISDCNAVMGDQELSSTDTAVRRLQAQVVFLSVDF